VLNLRSLLEPEAVRDRFIRSGGRRGYPCNPACAHDAGQRLSLFFGPICLVNLGVVAAIAWVLIASGVASFALWSAGRSTALCALRADGLPALFAAVLGPPWIPVDLTIAPLGRFVIV